MGLFNRNSNERNFAGGNKNLMEALQNDFQGEGVLIKRDTRVDFNTGSVVEVNPGEEAVFIKNGEIVGVLGNGTHTLSTENYPFLSRIRNMLTGGISTFPCKIYYVRTADTKIEWGTPNGIQFQDNFYACNAKARGYGAYWITFRDIPTFIARLMGNEYMYTSHQLFNEFNDYINGEVRKYIAKALSDMTATRTAETILGNCTDELIQLVHPKIQELLDEYGLELRRYVIATMEVDNDETRDAAIAALSQARAGAMALRETAIGKISERDILGDEYNHIKGMDLLQTLAENPGAGGAASTGAGIGMGVAAAGAFSGLASTVFSPVTSNRRTAAPAFGTDNNPFGNQPAPTPQSDPVEVLKQMKQLLDNGLINQEQYDAKVNEILNRM